MQVIVSSSIISSNLSDSCVKASSFIWSSCLKTRYSYSSSISAYVWISCLSYCCVFRNVGIIYWINLLSPTRSYSDVLSRYILIYFYYYMQQEYIVFLNLSLESVKSINKYPKNFKHTIISLNRYYIIVRLAKREERSIIQNLHNG